MAREYAAEFLGAGEMAETQRVFQTAADLAQRQGGFLPPWVWPPENARQLFVSGSIVAPANGVESLILQVQVPDGLQGVVRGVMHRYEGAGFTEGSGLALWNIKVNQALGSTTGRNVQGFFNVPFTLGNLVSPWPVPGSIYLKASDVLRYTVTTVAPMPVGGNNWYMAAVVGWLWPYKAL